MRRLAVCLMVAFVGVGRGDQFDYYTHPVLAKATGDGSVKAVKQLTADELADFASALPDTGSTFLVVVTNEKRHAKLLVQSARQKLGDQQVPMLLVDKFVTFKGTGERAMQATGATVHLYPGLRWSGDLGQVVPESVGGDLLVTAGEKGGWTLTPIKEAKLFVVEKPIAGVVPKKAAKLVPGEAFDPRFIAGRYKLHDDGRRSGVLKLEVNDAGEIAGTFTSDKDGREYEVAGKVGSPKHALTFTVSLPATKQSFTGHLFTGDGKAIAGTSKMLEREAGFYAERIDE